MLHDLMREHTQHTQHIEHTLLIFDADDTLRRTIIPGQPCPRAPHEWELLPGVSARLRSFTWGAAGVRLGVASNQDQVAYGHLTDSLARTLLTDMIAAATGHVPPTVAIQMCPHALEHPCECRKPAPAMLLRIMHSYGATPDETLFVGNALTDKQAAERAGVSFAFAHDFFKWGRE